MIFLQFAIRLKTTEQIYMAALGGAMLVLAAWLDAKGNTVKLIASLASIGIVAVVFHGTWISIAQDRDPPDAAYLTQLRNELAQLPGRDLRVDAVAARFVFDWRVPEDARNLVYCHPMPIFYPHASEVPRNALWLASLPLLHKFAPATAPSPYLRLRLGPIRMCTTGQCPYEIVAVGG